MLAWPDPRPTKARKYMRGGAQRIKEHTLSLKRYLNKSFQILESRLEYFFSDFKFCFGQQPIDI